MFTEQLGNILNKKTDHLVDWNRVGNLIGKHHYSTKELLERGFIIACTAAGGFLAKNQSEHGGLSSFVCGASLAFFISHTLIISPLIYKRLKTQWACNDIKARLEEQLKARPELSPVVSKIVDKILGLVCAKSSSAIWGHRLRVLTALEKLVNCTKSDELLTRLENPNFINHLLYDARLTTNSALRIK